MRIVLATALCLAAVTTSAQVYRWTDEKGRVHVSDTPPPASAKDVRKLRETSPAPAAAAEPGETFEVQQIKAKFPIKLYTTPNCEACNDARTLLNARGLPFTEVSVRDNAQIAELQKLAGANSVPVLLVGSSVQRGYEAGAFHSILDSAGYPKTGALPPRRQAEPEAPKPAVPEAKPAEEPERPTGPYAPGAPPQKKPAKK